MGKIITEIRPRDDQLLCRDLEAAAKGIENSECARTLPRSSRTGDGEVRSARRQAQAVTNPENTLYAIKRVIGRKFEEKEVCRRIIT